VLKIVIVVFFNLDSVSRQPIPISVTLKGIDRSFELRGESGLI
jgi:hypothetical protein